MSQGHKPWTQFVPGTIPGTKGDRESFMCLKFYVPFSLARRVRSRIVSVHVSHFCTTASSNARFTIVFSAVNQRGREKKGPPDIAPKSFSQKGPKWCSVLSIGVIGKSALEIGHFLRRNFWMISGGPFLSWPLCFTADVCQVRALPEKQHVFQRHKRMPETLVTTTSQKILQYTSTFYYNTPRTCIAVL